MKNNQMTTIVSSILMNINMIALQNTMSSTKMVTDIMVTSVVSVVNYYKLDRRYKMEYYVYAVAIVSVAISPLIILMLEFLK